MKRLYLLALEVVPLEVGRVYDELPSHLTLMSRFLSELSSEELAAIARPLFTKTIPIRLAFGKTITLGPKKVTVHLVESPDELKLHNELREILGAINVEFLFPNFTGNQHKAHITEREGVRFEPGSVHIVSTAYLIEVIDKKRAVRGRYSLSGSRARFESR